MGGVHGALFGENRVIGEILANEGDDDLFGAAVELRDQVPETAFEFEIVSVAEVFAQEFSGLMGRFDGEGCVPITHGAPQ
uniref:Uncharacterized protein n=2 Tax=Candidatus Bipolaricaulota TaxID=67810 RepID=H5SI77_9BACT|nr:hypothetical protein HGMM_F32F05C21 [uncultured Acetothermia bacterium]BAL58826.1 hypothetical protein HGMM_OP2C374 [Candidatus Acetothermum autotrophicum]